MSYTQPLNITINNPVLADKAAQKIQKVLENNIAWLEVSYGRARVGKQSKNETDITYPECQQTFGQDYINVFPNDNVLAQSYVLIQNDTVEQLGEGTNLVNWKADCAIVVFISDLDKIDTSYGANIEQKLREEIQNNLTTKARGFDYSDGSFSDEIETAYAEFSVDSLDGKYFNDHKKYAYLRFDGTVTYKTDCFSLYPYDGTFTFDPLKDFDFIHGSPTFLTY
jgi:hypothetical protein